jgi:hypothetical protein
MGVGKVGSRYMLAAACRGDNRMTLYSDEGPNIRTAELVLDAGEIHPVEIEFTPQDRVMNVRVDNRIVLRHPLDYLITAPYQIHCGLDDSFALKRRFAGGMTIATQEMARFPR